MAVELGESRSPWTISSSPVPATARHEAPRRGSSCSTSSREKASRSPTRWTLESRVSQGSPRRRSATYAALKNEGLVKAFPRRTRKASRALDRHPYAGATLISPVPDFPAPCRALTRARAGTLSVTGTGLFKPNLGGPRLRLWTPVFRPRVVAPRRVRARARGGRGERSPDSRRAPGEPRRAALAYGPARARPRAARRRRCLSRAPGCRIRGLQSGRSSRITRLHRARRALDLSRRQGAPVNIDAYCRWLARYFFARRATTRRTSNQEARIAAWLAPSGLGRVAARRQVMNVVRRAQRHPRLAPEVEIEVADTVTNVVDARERLRAALAEARTENERTALGSHPARRTHRLRGEGAPGRALAPAAQARRRLEDLEPVAGDEVELERVIVSTGGRVRRRDPARDGVRDAARPPPADQGARAGGRLVARRRASTVPRA